MAAFRATDRPRSAPATFRSNCLPCIMRARSHRSSGQRQQRSACGITFMQTMHERNMEEAHNHRRVLDLPPPPAAASCCSTAQPPPAASCCSTAQPPPAASPCSTAHDVTPRPATQCRWAGSIISGHQQSEAALPCGDEHAPRGDEHACPTPTGAFDAAAPHTTRVAFTTDTHNRSNHTYGAAAPASYVMRGRDDQCDAILFRILGEFRRYNEQQQATQQQQSTEFLHRLEQVLLYSGSQRADDNR